jgi:Uma2 family endonuclease
MTILDHDQLGEPPLSRTTCARIDRAEASDAVPVCLDGARACPPEDCGGPGGYEDLVAASRDEAPAEGQGRVAPEEGVSTAASVVYGAAVCVLEVTGSEGDCRWHLASPPLASTEVARASVGPAAAMQGKRASSRESSRRCLARVVLEVRPMLQSKPMGGARVTYEVPTSRPGWELPEEETVPESVPHDTVVYDLVSTLKWWAREMPEVGVARNLAVRWDASQKQVGTDPDVCVLQPRPPEFEKLVSLRTWREGHDAPRLAVEVVSGSNAKKDYLEVPDKHAAAGTEELWVFDPQLVGPRAHGGPVRLQVWRRSEGAFVREYVGEGPAWSTYLRAWLVTTEGGAKLRVASSADGTGVWPTAEEAERAAKEAERAAKEAALAEVASLRAELARTRGG